MNLKIREHYLDKSNGQSKLLLDIDGKLSIIYVTNHGLQILHLENPDLTPEQVHPIFKFIQEYLDTISEEEKPNEESEQSTASSQSKTIDPSGEIPISNVAQNPQSVPQTEGCGKSESLGGDLGKEA